MIIMLAIAVGAPTVPVFNTYLGPMLGVKQAQAQAQEKKKRKSLFEVLFKRRKKKKQTNIKVVRPPKNTGTARSTQRRKTQQARKKTRRTTTRRAAAAAPAVAAIKNENAAKILVVGDFLAGGMARELSKLYASNPNIVVINKSDPSSGLVRDDVVDWPKRIPELIAELKPIAVVNLVGMNDRQKLWKYPGQPEKLSAKWLEEYNKRVTTITTATASNKVPLVWVGLPPVRSTRMNTDYLIFNEIYRTKIEMTGGGEYVDIWDGFTNEEGKFVSAGPDINGQIVRLRGQKGINMTRAGRAKLAFFADKALRKIGVIGNEGNFEFASLGTINLNSAQPNAPQYDPVGTGRTNIIALGSPSLDGGSALEGGEEEKASKEEDEKNTSVSYELVEQGRALLPKAGRIDAAWGTPVIAKPEEEKQNKAEDKKDEKKTSEVNIENRLAPASAPTVTNIRPVAAN